MRRLVTFGVRRILIVILAAGVLSVAGCDERGVGDDNVNDNLSQYCGNRVAEGEEECDGDDLAGQTCESLGFVRGTLRCGYDCVLDTWQCFPAVCGNGVREGDEICDGADLAGQQCRTIGPGYACGELGCGDACDRWDTTDCRPGAVQHLWSRRFGDASHEYSMDLAVDTAGNIVVTGVFGGSIDFGGPVLTCVGQSDVFLVKFDPDGAHLWSHAFPSPDAESGVNYLGDAGLGVAVDREGNIVVTGTFDATADFGGLDLVSSGSEDVFVAKFGPGGDHLWSLALGDTLRDLGTDVAVDPLGNVVVALTLDIMDDCGFEPCGSGGEVVVAKLDPDGSLLWSQSHGHGGGMRIAVDSDGNIVFTGGLTLDWLMSSVFITMVDPDGGPLWSHSFDDPPLVGLGTGVAVDRTGNLVLTGTYWGSGSVGGTELPAADGTSVFVAKFDGGGQHLWSHGFPVDAGGTSALPWAAVADRTGGMVVTGSFEGAVNLGGQDLVSRGETDIFLAIFDHDGNHLMSRGFGSDTEGGEAGTGVAVDGAGDIAFTGEFRGTVSFGGPDLVSAGASDVFLAKFRPLGCE